MLNLWFKHLTDMEEAVMELKSLSPKRKKSSQILIHPNSSLWLDLTKSRKIQISNHRQKACRQRTRSTIRTWKIHFRLCKIRGRRPFLKPKEMANLQAENYNCWKNFIKLDTRRKWTLSLFKLLNILEMVMEIWVDTKGTIRKIPKALTRSQELWTQLELQ